ncbi:MAG TPA: TrmH family RNA methyltransferase [Chloroflexota bacterium]
MPRTTRVHTADNHFQHADVLRRNRRRRQQYGEFFLEGVRPIDSALAHGWRINSYYYSPERGLSDWARDILNNSTADEHFELSPDLLQALSGKTEGSELVALAAIPEDGLSRIPVRDRMLVVLFDRPANPGNLGTLIRSCDALGGDGLIVTGHSADLYDPETISASRGSLFALPVVRVGGINDLLPWLAEARRQLGEVQLVGADEQGDRVVWETEFTKPMILLVGNEKWGLSAGLRQLSDALVRVPISGSASSLNVACAASVVLYEVERQRRQNE